MCISRMCLKVGENDSDLDSEREEDSGSSNHPSGKLWLMFCKWLTLSQEWFSSLVIAAVDLSTQSPFIYSGASPFTHPCPFMSCTVTSESMILSCIPMYAEEYT